MSTNEFKTTTDMIVKDGETLMLSGILMQNDREIERKIPLLGDLPLLGGLFRHYDTVKSNTELLAFITPYVMGSDRDVETQQQLDEARSKMESIIEELDAAVPHDR